MKRVLVIIICGVLAWGGYWFWGAAQKKSALEAWFDARQASGWQAEYSDLRVTGFPNRFDIMIDALQLADTNQGLAWSAPFLQIFSLIYRQQHLIAVWPPTHRVATPQGHMDISQEDLRASVVFDDLDTLALNRFSLVGADMHATTPKGVWTAETLQLAGEKEPVAPAEYKLALNAANVTLPISAALSGDLPAQISDVSLDLRVGFDRTWDGTALAGPRPQPTEITINQATAHWGALTLAMSGALSVDARGTPAGDLTIKAENWVEMMDLAVAMGALPQRSADQAKTLLVLVAQSGGTPNDLDVTLRMSGGMMRIGPLPIGPAPRIHLR